MLISNVLASTFLGALLFIDGVIYDLIRNVYDIFIFLAKLNLFNENDYNEIVNRIYIILGVVMLFVLAYSLLKAVINPDDIKNKDGLAPKLIKNVVISLILIAILPVVFTIAFNIQASILNSDVIPKLILNDSSGVPVTAEYVKNEGGASMAFYTFRAFFQPDEDYCRGELNIESDNYIDECADKIESNTGILKWYPDATLASAFNDIYNDEKSFRTLDIFSNAVDEGQINYMCIVSTVAGVLLLYILIAYCVDLALRVIKLMFFQIIAPIPVIARILPNDKGKKVFDSWLKNIITTFVEVFIKIAIMYLGVYLITLVIHKLSPTNIANIPGIGLLGPIQRGLVVALLIIGILLFVKQAPKLIKDIFGIDMTSGGILGRLLGMGAATGAGITAGVRNYNISRAKGQNILSSALSGVAGVGSGMVRGGWAARSAKNLKDMKSGASAGAKGATTAKAKRAAYRASHGGTLGAMGGHVSDMGTRIKRWAGTDAGLDALKARQEVYQEGLSFKNDLFSLVADNESVSAYTGLKKAAQDKDISDYMKNLEISNGQVVYRDQNGQKHTYKDANERTYNNLEAAAIAMKTEDIKKYDNAIKLASMRAIHEKIDNKDARYTGLIEKFKVYQQQHSDDAIIQGLRIDNEGKLTQEQLDKINAALGSNNFKDINDTADLLKDVEKSKTILSMDDVIKKEKSNIEADINRQVQQRQNNNNS